MINVVEAADGKEVGVMGRGKYDLVILMSCCLNMMDGRSVSEFAKQPYTYYYAHSRSEGGR